MVVILHEVAITLLQEVMVMDLEKTKIQDHTPQDYKDHGQGLLGIHAPMVSCPTPYKKFQPNGKSLPYPIYTAGTDPDAHVQVFCKAIQANGEKNDDGIVNLFIFTHHDAMYPNEEKIYESKSNLQI